MLRRKENCRREEKNHNNQEVTKIKPQSSNKIVSNDHDKSIIHDLYDAVEAEIKDSYGLDASNTPKAVYSALMMKGATDKMTFEQNINFVTKDSIPSITMLTGNYTDLRFVPISLNTVDQIQDLLNNFIGENGIITNALQSKNVSKNVKNNLINSLNNLLRSSFTTTCNIMIENELYAVVEQCVNKLRNEYDVYLNISTLLEKMKEYNNYYNCSNGIFNFSSYNSSNNLNDMNDETFDSYLISTISLFSKKVTISGFYKYASALRDIIYSSDTQDGLIDLSTLYNFCITFTQNLFICMENAISFNMISLFDLKLDVDASEAIKLMPGIIPRYDDEEF